jgi:hypothetical protein
MTMACTVKEEVQSMRFETHDCASMLFRHVDIDLADYPMLVWRWYVELPICNPPRRAYAGRGRPSGAAVSSIPGRP